MFPKSHIIFLGAAALRCLVVLVAIVSVEHDSSHSDTRLDRIKSEFLSFAVSPKLTAPHQHKTKQIQQGRTAIRPLTVSPASARTALEL